MPSILLNQVKMRGKLLPGYLFIVLYLFFASAVHAQSKNERQILSVMSAQTAAWNNGDIDAFMQTYRKSDSLMFIGKNGVTYGWQNTLNNYKKSYPDKTAMGHLTFNIIRVQRLSSKYYNVVGKWHLKRSIGDLTGHFSLIFKKISGNWVIIQDHSS